MRFIAWAWKCISKHRRCKGTEQLYCSKMEFCSWVASCTVFFTLNWPHLNPYQRWAALVKVLYNTGKLWEVLPSFSLIQASLLLQKGHCQVYFKPSLLLFEISLFHQGVQLSCHISKGLQVGGHSRVCCAKCFQAVFDVRSIWFVWYEIHDEKKALVFRYLDKGD